MDHNLSSIDIPDNVKLVLQLGQRFNLIAFSTYNNIINKEKNVNRIY